MCCTGVWYLPYSPSCLVLGQYLMSKSALSPHLSLSNSKQGRHEDEDETAVKSVSITSHHLVAVG